MWPDRVSNPGPLTYDISIANTDLYMVTLKIISNVVDGISVKQKQHVIHVIFKRIMSFLNVST